MKREDAIKTLKELWRETNDPWYEEVYNMAINALETDRKDEPTISKMEQVEDELQTNGYQTFNGTSVYVSRLEDEPQMEEWYTYQDEQEYNARHGKE